MKNNKFFFIIIIVLIIFNIFTILILYKKYYNAYNEINFLKYQIKEYQKDTLIIQIIFSIIENDYDFFSKYFNINLNNLKWKNSVINEFYITKTSLEYIIYFKNDFVLEIYLVENNDKIKKYKYKIYSIDEITGGEGKKPYNQFPKGKFYYFIGKYKIYRY